MKQIKNVYKICAILMVLFAILTACDKRTTVNLAELETASVTETEEETAEALETEEATSTTEASLEAPEQTTEALPETTEAPTAGEKTEKAYVLNINSKKIHYPTCESVQKMKPSNKKEYTGTVEELRKQGYVPCKMCKPE